ncbi:hypothetical protein F5Y12DRAFT_461847 [Xylaria sp. FL1777]|nr:hypothetical protein F5Y12DRAFT_461847 [Xylaria sp. FL1777]
MISRNPMRNLDEGAFRDHFEWGCHRTGPFISFFSDWNRALRWREMLISKGGQNIVVIAVWLHGLEVFDAYKIACHLKCPNLAQHMNEYLLHGGIYADQYRILAIFHGSGDLEPVKLSVAGSEFTARLPRDFVRSLVKLPGNTFGNKILQDITEDVKLEVYSLTGDKGGFRLERLLLSIQQDTISSSNC